MTNLTRRTICLLIAALTLVATLIDLAHMLGRSGATLLLAELVKFGIGTASIMLAWQLRQRRSVGMFGGTVMLLAGLTGIAAVALHDAKIGSAVTVLALSAVAIIGFWGIGLPHVSAERWARLAAGAMGLSAIAALIFAPLGLICAMFGLLWWLMLARALRPD